MNRKRFSLTLAACTVWAGACLVFGDENTAAAPVVYLGRSSLPALPASKDELCGRLLQEFARQSFLVSARDQLGLRTRDVSLGDEMPGGGGDDAPFEVLAQFKSHSQVDVRRGFALPRKTLWDEALRATTASERISPVKSFTSIDYRAVLAEMEELSRGRFVDAIKQAGFQGKANALKDSADVPQWVETALRRMDFVSQFSVVREVHELIRADGESPERLGALVRAYANLGLLTEFHWHPAHKAFKARALVYAQRMVSRDKQPWRATWHRAYAFALAGFHRLALDDLRTAAKQRQAAHDAGPRPPWVGLLSPYCHFSYAKLKAAGEEGPERNLALLLWFDSIEHSQHKASILTAGLETLRRLPDCYPATEALCEHGGVSVGHMASSLPLVMVGKTLYARTLVLHGLPPAAVKAVEAAGENLDVDDELPVKEFAARAKLIRALLESDGGGPAKAADAAPPAKRPAAALDRGEPTWVCLGRMVSNLSFIHVCWRTSFLHRKLGMPAADFLQAAAPLVEAHPYRQFLATYVTDPRSRRLAWEQVTIPEPDDLEYQEASLWTEYQTRHLPAAAAMGLMVAGRQDLTPRDCYTLSSNAEDVDHAWWSAVLLSVSPFSPVGRAWAIEFCGDDYKSHFGEWEKAAAKDPGLAMAFARRATAARHWEEAEKWLKLVTATGDTDACWELCKAYELQGKWDLWLATLEDTLKRPDFGLDHASAQTSMARYYMHGKQWEKAMPHAKQAAECYSAWGLLVLAECHEAMHHWSDAEAIYRAVAERYSGEVADWYDFCQRTGHGDLAAARRKFVEVTPPTRTILVNREAAVYYLLEKDLDKVHTVFEHLARDGNPVCDLHLALLADQAHDKSTRNKILDRVKQKGAQYRWKKSRQSYASFAALAGLMADDLAKGGKGEIDVAAAERLYPPQPFVDEGCCGGRDSRPGVACPYLLGRYFDLHGKPELAVRCWKRCLAQTEFVADFHRTLAAAELRARGVQSEPEEPRTEKDAEKPESTPSTR